MVNPFTVANAAAPAVVTDQLVFPVNDRFPVVLPMATVPVLDPVPILVFAEPLVLIVVVPATANPVAPEMLPAASMVIFGVDKKLVNPAPPELVILIALP